VRRVSGQQLAADFHFGASRERPVLIEVVAVEGKSIAPTRLVVMDTHSVWLSHQAEFTRRINGKPASPTGLSAAEAPAARELFLSLVGEPESGLTVVSPPPARAPHLLVRVASWVGKHAVSVVTAVTIAVLTTIILAWLGLKQ